MSEPIVSLCIPTNGVLEWVIPVLDSIYAQNIDENLFEVIVADNGNNTEFVDIITEYAFKKTNFVYKRTTAEGFLNQTESYKIARGMFIKFINHRMLLLPGALQALIDFVTDNMENKPVVYFSNGKLTKLKKEVNYCKNFDDFVNKLSYWSSWSAGIALWKEDLNLLDKLNFNNLFPHTDILFSRRDCNSYIINNKFFLYEIPTNWALKGGYNLFNAFAVEYVAIILDLYRIGAISKKTFLKIKKDNFSYISDRYIIYVFFKKKCSFDLTDFKDSINFFYSLWLMKLSVLRLPVLLLRKFLLKKQSQRFKALFSNGD